MITFDGVESVSKIPSHCQDNKGKLYPNGPSAKRTASKFTNTNTEVDFRLDNPPKPVTIDPARKLSRIRRLGKSRSLQTWNKRRILSDGCR